MIVISLARWSQEDKPLIFLVRLKYRLLDYNPEADTTAELLRLYMRDIQADLLYLAHRLGIPYYRIVEISSGLGDLPGVRIKLDIKDLLMKAIDEKLNASKRKSPL